MGMYSATVIKELYFYLLCVLKSLSLDKSERMFVDKKNVQKFTMSQM